MEKDDNFHCPHCFNDDKSMMDEIAWDTMGNRRINCQVCSRDFIVKVRKYEPKEEPRTQI